MSLRVCVCVDVYLCHNSLFDSCDLRIGEVLPNPCSLPKLQLFRIREAVCCSALQCVVACCSVGRI